MSDRAFREAERAWEEHRTPETHARLMVARARAGLMPKVLTTAIKALTSDRPPDRYLLDVPKEWVTGMRELAETHDYDIVLEPSFMAPYPFMALLTRRGTWAEGTKLAY